MQKPTEEESDTGGRSVGHQLESSSDEPPVDEDSASGDHNLGDQPESPSDDLQGRRRCEIVPEPAAGDEPGSPALQVARGSQGSPGGSPQERSRDSASDELRIPSPVDDVTDVSPERPHTAPPMSSDPMTNPVCSTFSDSEIDRAARRLGITKTAHNVAAAQGKSLDVEAMVREAAAFQESEIDSSDGCDANEDSATAPPGQSDESTASDDAAVASVDSSDERTYEGSSTSSSDRHWLPCLYCRYICRYPRACLCGRRLLILSLSVGTGIFIFTSLSLTLWLVLRHYVSRRNPIPALPEPTTRPPDDDSGSGGHGLLTALLSYKK